VNATDDTSEGNPADTPPEHARARAARRRDGAGDGPLTLDSAALFAGRSEVRLLHRGQEYRLRVTRQGKLILTK
jgi:hemin uptake protein HemP